MKAALTLVALVALAAMAAAQVGCDGEYNGRPINAFSPKLVKQVTNGKLYTVGENDKDQLRVMHLFGTPEEMGAAQGLILGDEIVQMREALIEYIDNDIAPYVKNLPKDIREILLNDGPDAALEFEADLVRKYIPDTYFQELKGMASTLMPKHPNMTAEELLRINLFPELIRASCSMFGTWGQAVAKSPGELYQLRALDWGLDNPLINHSLVTVYHPNSDNGHAFLTVGFAGLIGSITAYSGYAGLSEKVYLEDPASDYSPFGVPFHFIMRDIAQYDETIDSALNRVYNNPRTCSIHLGVGSNSHNEFRLVEYSHDLVEVYDDKNYAHYSQYHPQMDGVVFVDKHVQPSNHTCLGSLMTKYYGQYTPELTIRNITAVHASGDMHAAVWDFSGNMAYVSVAGPSTDNSGNIIPNSPTSPAHARPWYTLDIKKLFSVSP